MIQKILGISEHQQRFWLEWKLHPKSGKYNTPLVYKIQGALNVPALRLALDLYVNQYHTGNRHYFGETEKGVVQYVLDEIKVNLQIVNFEDLTSNPLTPAPSLQEYLETLCHHHFDLEKPPLFKFDLINVSSEEFILILNFHHIITDAFTGSFVVKGVSALYNHFASQFPLPIPPKPYDAYIENECHFLPENRKQAALDYWQQKLMDNPPYVDFNLPAHMVSATESDGDSIFFSLDSETSAQIKPLAKQLGSTVFMVLSAVYALCLYRYTQQKSIVLSYAINTRPAEYQETPGCFMNVLPLIVVIDNALSFSEILEVCTTERKENKSHMSCSLSQILHHLHKANPGSKSSIENSFNVSIIAAFLNQQPLDLQGLSVESIEIAKQNVFNDLSLYYDFSDDLKCRLDYRKDLFSKAFVQNFSRNFQHILQCVLKDANTKIQQALLSLPSELQRIQQWNSTVKVLPQDLTLWALFEKAASLHPEAIAVSCEEKKLSYLMLKHHCQHLAEKLQGLQKQGIVALCLDKSLAYVIAMLACLKTQQCYLPLDITDTPARIQHRLDHSKAEIVICLKKDLPKFPFLKNKNLIFLDGIFKDIIENSELTEISEISQASPVLPSLAYVIYTSGSTGDPKGVMISEHSLLNIVLDVKEKLQFSAKDTVLSVTSPAFDVYALELFLPLISGAEHSIVPTDFKRDPQKVATLIQTKAPTFMQGTPSFWSMLLPYLKPSANLTLFSVGEKMSNTLAKALMQISENAWNVYGPTETTILSTYFKLQPHLPPYIGRAFANTELHVLDDAFNALPIGAVGMLYIAGQGLSLGYLNNPTQTQRKFLTHPKTGTKLYKTEDLVRWTDSGFLEYIGRKDSQYKIRGHRVELEEIEAVLQNCPGIVNAAVLCQPENDSQHLIAYYQIRKQTFIEKLLKIKIFPSTTEISDYLKKQLPDYMLPTFLIPVDSFPFTPSGKIDRRQLPVPNRAQYQSNFQTKEHKPADMLELQLHQIWRDLLKISDIAETDDFFKIGGNSLLAVFLISKLKEKFGIQQPVAWVSQNPSIQSQANQLRHHPELRYQYEPITCFNAGGLQTPLFFVHPSISGAEVYHGLAKHLDKNIPFYAIDSHNLNSGAPFITCLKTLANQYIQQLRTIQAQGPYYLGGWSMGGIIAYEMAQQLRQAGEQVDGLYILDSHLYEKEYLGYLKKNLTLKSLLRQLPNERGKYLRTLPKPYLDRVQHAFLQDIHMLRSYTLKSYIGKALLIKTAIRTFFNLGIFEDKYNGWKKYIPNIERSLIQTDHLSLLEERAAAHVAAAIHRDLRLKETNNSPNTTVVIKPAPKVPST